MEQPISKQWIRKYQKGPYHRIPLGNFEALDRPPRKPLFLCTIQKQAIDLYVYNADTSDLVFGRANLNHAYPRELAHHIGIVRAYMRLGSEAAEKHFGKGSLDIAVDHSLQCVYFKHLTLGLEDMIFPPELEWVTHIGSLQDMAMLALREIGMPISYRKQVIKASEWARVRTGLMRGEYIPYEKWKSQLKARHYATGGLAEESVARRKIMRTIKLKKKPSFYGDNLMFSHWLTQDRILSVILDSRNRVEEITLDKAQYVAILRELRAHGYA